MMTNPNHTSRKDRNRLAWDRSQAYKARQTASRLRTMSPGGRPSRVDDAERAPRASHRPTGRSAHSELERGEVRLEIATRGGRRAANVARNLMQQYAEVRLG